MSKAKRETKKPPQPIPPIPDLGKLHKPRKGNRNAAKLIADGVRLWDKRHLERTARRRALAQQAADEQHRLRLRATEKFLAELLEQCPGWKLSPRPISIEPQEPGTVAVEELISGAQKISSRPPASIELSFRVAGLTYRELIRLRAALPPGINCSYSYHERTATAENRGDLNLWDYDPRVRGELSED